MIIFTMLINNTASMATGVGRDWIIISWIHKVQHTPPCGVSVFEEERYPHNGDVDIISPNYVTATDIWTS